MGQADKKHPDPNKDNEMVEFYLERQQFMDPSKRYTIPINVNGYEFEAEFGKRNLLPKSVVAVLKNAKSAIHPMRNADRVDRVIGGEGRNQSELLQNQTDYQYVNDYNVVEEREA